MPGGSGLSESHSQRIHLTILHLVETAYYKPRSAICHADEAEKERRIYDAVHAMSKSDVQDRMRPLKMRVTGQACLALFLVPSF